MHALIAALWTLTPLYAHAPDDPIGATLASVEESPAASTVVRKVQSRRRPSTAGLSSEEDDGPSPVPRNTQPEARVQAQGQQKNGFLEFFWTILPPPGDYSMEVGLSAGASYLETAFGGINPNVIFRGHFAMRPKPRELPFLFWYGALDHTSYEQTAGDLRYTSRYTGLSGGGGVLAWVGPLKFDLAAEAGMFVRNSTQTDGEIEPITQTHVQPYAGFIGGGALAFGGRVSLSLKAAGRFYGNPVRSDWMVLYGVEWLIDADPVDRY